MPSIRDTVAHLVDLVRARLPGLSPPRNRESPLPYVANRPTVNPILPVSDMDRAVGFYRTVGFAVTEYDAGYAWVRTCGWEFFHLALAPALEPGGSTAAAYLHVADVDEWHRAITTNAPDVAVGDVIAQPWGMREFSLADPDGNVMRIGRHG
jgi:predicted enzyme related to lactoylglutathione lyase